MRPRMCATRASPPLPSKTSSLSARGPEALTTSTNGTEAMKFLLGSDGSGVANKGRALLILLDLNLPDMSGVDILRRLKETPKTERIPVIVLTTTDDKNEIQRCYDLGANVYVTKPVNYENFANAIRQLGLFFSVVQVPEL